MGSKQLIALGCALVAAAVTVVITGVAAAAAATVGAGVPRVSHHQRVEQAGRHAAGGGQLGHDDQCDRRPDRRASRLRFVSGLRDSLQRRRREPEEGRRQDPVRERELPRRLSDSGPSAHRGGFRSPPADRGQDPLPAVRALVCASHVEGLAGRFGGDLEPALQQPAPRGLDERRRRGAADPAGTRALPGGRQRRDQPRAAVHRARHVQRLHLSGPARGRAR